MNQLNREKACMQRASVLKSRRWRHGDGLCERLTGLLGAVRNRGPLLLLSLLLLLFSDSAESRRWRHGEWRCINAARNDAVFEMRRMG